MGKKITHKAYDSSSKIQPDLCSVMFKAVVIVLLPTIQVTFGYSQMTVTQNANTQTLAQLLAGTGVTISNYTKTCDNNGTGTFTAVNTNLGITQGVVLASGRVQNIPQAANNFASTQFTNSGDPQLSALTNGTIYDKCVLEFDIVPQGNELRFDYVFASEEYPEFVCSPYNDVFGFFISGPNPTGGLYVNKNIATIPGSTTPVFINSVNPGISGTYNGTTWNPSNCQSLTNTNFYINNLNPVNASIVYDGMTVVLSANAKVIPCQTYHLKLAIADVGDRIYDSGVFLKAYSFTSASVTVSASAQLDYAGFTSAYEGCVGGMFTVNTSSAQAVDDTIDLLITGTATNGVDYATIPTKVIIPAGQTSVTIPLTPMVDGITEVAESVTISVINPCTGLPVSSATLNIEDNIPISLTVSDSTLCSGQSATLIATGGLAYAWSPVATLSSSNMNSTIATPVTNTNYSVTVSFGGCTQTLSQMVYVSNPTVSISVAPGNVICNGGTATFTSSVSGAANPYTYLWSNGASANNISVTDAGSYSLTVTDANGCTANASSTVAISNLGISAIPTNVSCYGGNNGSVSVIATGGSAPYVFTWENGSHANSLHNLSQGNYNVTVSDANTCSASVVVNVTQPSAALSATANTSSVSCYGGNNGAVNLSVSGGTPPYNYSWSNGVTTPNLSGQSAGTYTVTVTDSKNCSVTAQAIISQPVSALSVTTSAAHVLCYGENTGSVTTLVSGGTAPYNYNWGSGITTPNRTNLSVGSYTVTVTDANGCSAVKSATVTQPSATLAVSLSATHVSCYGGTNGTVTSNVSGGTLPYTMLWSNNATSGSISSLNAGYYSLSVTDANGCSVTGATVITQPSAALSATDNTSSVSCYGGNNGAVNLSVSGGTPPYNYSWSNGTTTPNLSGQSAGTYTVTVTDSKNCSVTAQAIITQPMAPLYVVTTVDSVSCYGGTNGGALANVIGGTPPYTFFWSNNQTAQSISSLTAGLYSVTVTDSKTCSSIGTANVIQPLAPLYVAASKTDVSCYGSHDGEVAASVSGGTPPYFYEWNNNAAQPNQSGLVAGNYNITVTDVNGCSTTASATISQPSPLVVSEAHSNVLCYGGNSGSAQVTVSGGNPGYVFNWSNGKISQSVNSLSAGVYSVTVSDDNLCTVSVSVSITQPSLAINAAAFATNVSCNGLADGGVYLTVTGGVSPYSYLWSNGNTTQFIQGLTAGGYTVTVTDANGCSVSTSQIVSQPYPLNVSEVHTPVKCFGSNTGTAQISVTGGTAPYSYQWSNGALGSGAQGLAAGNYVVTVRDANECVADISIAITQPPVLNLAANVTDVLCYGTLSGAVQTTVTGGTPPYNYHWSTGATTPHLNNVAANSYTLTVTDANGCSSSVSKTILQPAPLVILESHTAPLCFGTASGSVDVTVTGGTPAYSYNWSNNAATQNISDVAAGLYTVTVTDTYLCSAVRTVTVTEPTAVTLTETHQAPECYNGNNGTISVQAVGGTPAYQYYWSNGANGNTAYAIAAGSYGVTVVDAHGCSAALSTITVSQPDSLMLSLSATDVKCSETATGSIVCNVVGGTSPYFYYWSNNSSSANLQHIEAGVYTLTVTDAHGCNAVSSAMVNDVAPLIVKGSDDTIACANAKANILLSVYGGVAPYTYQWNNGDTTQDLMKVTSGVYHVTVTDANGCMVDTLFMIVNLNQFTVDASGGGIVTLGQPVSLNAISNGSPFVTYSWSPSQTIECSRCANTVALPTTYTTYTVLATDTNGCTAQDTVSAKVIDDYTVFTPNAFTPNADGNNDYFRFYGNTAGLKYINIMIFDRWGEKVFEADDPHFKWDGIYKGEPVPPGVYVYVMKLVFLNGHADKIHKGSITVIR